MPRELPSSVRVHAAALRMVVVLTIVLGVGYAAAMTAAAQLPGLRHQADGSLVSLHGRSVGSTLIGQAFTDAKGNPIPKYFQSRPSAAGAGYDPTATGASNLGPESIVDVLPDPSVKGDTGRPSLLTQVCSRSKAVGELEGVDGRRAYCTADGIGAVLSVIHAHGLTGRVTAVVSVNQACPARPFVSTWDGVAVQCATYGRDYRVGQIVPVRGAGRAWPANPVPPDAVTASGSGVDPDISLPYAELQARRVARARGLPLQQVSALVRKFTSQRTLGFMGEPVVNVLQLNLAVDRLGG